MTLTNEDLEARIEALTEREGKMRDAMTRTVEAVVSLGKALEVNAKIAMDLADILDGVERRIEQLEPPQ